MKRFLAVFTFTVILAIGSVFAEHPNGWGVGILGQGGWSYGQSGLAGAAISLKAPMLPVYWGINLHLGSNYLGLGLTGDYYLIDKKLANLSGPALGWYLGIGGFLGLGIYDGGSWTDNSNGKKYTASWTSLSFGARLPIGLSFQVPVSSISLEIFAALIPNLGLGFWFWDANNNDYWERENRSRIGLSTGVGGELGLRIWF
jgi:hypothetical protein